jgi:hypothetical protein
MPKFPTYRDELPECLNPCKLWHYFLLLYWVFFRPSALKYYLYQAEPDMYHTDSERGIFRTWYVPIYRNLYVVGLGVIMLFSVLFSLPFVLLNSRILDIPTDWLRWMGDVVSGLLFGVLGGVVVGMVGGVAVDVVVGVMSGMASIIVSGVAGIVGGLRLIFYPVQFALALCSVFREVRHPLEWDELIVLPLPHTRWLLTQRLRQNEDAGLRLLAEISSNPFQWWAVQTVLYHYFHTHPTPLSFLYNLVTNPDIEEYVIPPFRTRYWERNITVRHLFLWKLAFLSLEINRDLDNTVWNRFVFTMENLKLLRMRSNANDVSGLRMSRR